MRQELDGNELENIVGGTVVISKDYMTIGFSSTREKFSLQNCTYKECRNYVEDLKDEHRDMTNAQFDAFVRDKLRTLGWIPLN